MGSWAADLVPRCVWPASPSAPWLSPLSRPSLGSSQVSLTPGTVTSALHLRPRSDLRGRRMRAEVRAPVRVGRVWQWWARCVTGGGGYARDVRPCLRVPEVGAGVAPGPRWRRGAQRPSPARPRLLARRPRPRLRPAGFAGWRAREPRARDRRMSDWGPGSRQRTRPPSPPARAPRPRGPDPGRAARVPRARARALRAMPGRP